MNKNITIYSRFSDVSNPIHVSIDEALDRVKNGNSKEIVEGIRTIQDKEERNKLKKKLPCILFSGVFNERSDASIREHSGFICLDFDGYDDSLDLDIAMATLREDKYVYSMFMSPSGKGIKVIIQVEPDIKKHRSFFKALGEYYDKLVDGFDKSCINESRICYESYDPNIYTNRESIVWSTEFVEPEKPKKKEQIGVPLTDEGATIKKIKKWWNKNFGLIDGQRNDNIFKLAAAFNDFGIDEPKALDAMREYEQSDFPFDEIERTVRQAYLKTSEFGSKSLDDFDKIDEIKMLIVNGVDPSEISEKYKISDIAISNIKERVSDMEFWVRSEKGRISVIPYKYRDFLTENGFYKYYPEGSDSFLFIRITDNIIDTVTEDTIKDFTIQYLENVEDKSVFNHYALDTKMQGEKFLSVLPNISPNFLFDKADVAYLYYQNCALKINKDSIDVIPYDKLDGLIWRKQIIDREFSIADYEYCEYRKFIKNISANEEARLRSIESTIGFLMHSFKPPSFCPAVILNDETISDAPEGGTGKGIFVKALSHVKNNETIDGKAFMFSKSFLYQRLSPDTQIITYDDVKSGFDFEKLFSIITEGITIEKKNRDEIHIPFERSPKVVITTNYAIRGTGNSHERRKWELEFSGHYKKSFTPLQEFGHNLFTDWSREEWMMFDNYMISCLQLYLGNDLIQSPFKNLGIRQFEAATSPEFRMWALDVENYRDVTLNADVEYLGQDLFNDFTRLNPDYGPMGKYKMAHQTFYRYLDKYCNFKFGTKMIKGRNAIGITVTFPMPKKEDPQLKANL